MENIDFTFETCEIDPRTLGFLNINPEEVSEISVCVDYTTSKSEYCGQSEIDVEVEGVRFYGKNEMVDITKILPRKFIERISTDIMEGF